MFPVRLNEFLKLCDWLYNHNLSLIDVGKVNYIQCYNNCIIEKNTLNPFLFNQVKIFYCTQVGIKNTIHCKIGVTFDDESKLLTQTTNSSYNQNSYFNFTRTLPSCLLLQLFLHAYEENDKIFVRNQGQSALCNYAKQPNQNSFTGLYGKSSQVC